MFQYRIPDREELKLELTALFAVIGESHHSVFIQERCLSVWEHDLLILPADFVMLFLKLCPPTHKVPCAEICCAFAQTYLLKCKYNACLDRFPRLRFQPLSLLLDFSACWQNFCSQIFSLLADFPCDSHGYKLVLFFHFLLSRAIFKGEFPILTPGPYL